VIRAGIVEMKARIGRALSSALRSGQPHLRIYLTGPSG
jgi:hypothetical protein